MGCIPAGLHCRLIQTAALRYDGPNGGVCLGSSTLSYMWHSCSKSFRGPCGWQRNLQRVKKKPWDHPRAQEGAPNILNINGKYTWGGLRSWSWTRIIIVSLSCRQDLATSCRILCSLSIWTQNLIRDKMKRSLTCHSATLGVIIIFLTARLD